MKPPPKNFKIQMVSHEYATSTNEYLRYVIVTPDLETAWATESSPTRPVLLRSRNMCSVAKFRRWLREHYPQAQWSGKIGQLCNVFREMRDARLDLRVAKGEIEQ